MAKTLSFKKHLVGHTTLFHLIIQASGQEGHDYFPVTKMKTDVLSCPDVDEKYFNVFHIPGVKDEHLSRTNRSLIRCYKLQKPGFKNLKMLVSFNPTETKNGLKVFHYFLLDDNLMPVTFDNLDNIVKLLTVKKLTKVL